MGPYLPLSKGVWDQGCSKAQIVSKRFKGRSACIQELEKMANEGFKVFRRCSMGVMWVFEALFSNFCGSATVFEDFKDAQ